METLKRGLRARGEFLWVVGAIYVSWAILINNENTLGPALAWALMAAAMGANMFLVAVYRRLAERNREKALQILADWKKSDEGWIKVCENMQTAYVATMLRINPAAHTTTEHVKLDQRRPMS